MKASQFKPSSEDIALAKAALRGISPQEGGSAETGPYDVEQVFAHLGLPKGVVQLLVTMLRATAEGHALTLIAGQKEMTTQEAAEFLSVSRPFLIRLLKSGALPYRLVGKHRLIRLEDLIDYQVRCSVRQEGAMQDLVELSEDLKLY
ncbi:MAG: helix-turn-helix domain-containing protein [Deltaproteobacteria bacterium]|nr:helix-turn-helix domain-containing protein [Deltaproteobacteria bacterium]